MHHIIKHKLGKNSCKRTKNPKKSLSFNQNKYKQRDGRKKNLSIQSF